MIDLSDALQTFIQRYPQSFFVIDARTRLDLLERRSSVSSERDKLVRLLDATAEQLPTPSGGTDFRFDLADEAAPAPTAEAIALAAEVEDAPVVRFLQKMLIDAVNARASDLHFEPYESH